MKILIVSDTHRDTSNFYKAVEQNAPLDMVIHLGDVEGSDFGMRRAAGCPMEIVAGNSDFFSDLPREKEIEIEGYKILLTHGNFYLVTLGMERIREEGRERGVDIVMFGHTHKPLLDIDDEELMLINPGSLSFPRQEGKRPSYIIMEIDEKGELQFELKYI